jgi:hypothetical protein
MMISRKESLNLPSKSFDISIKQSNKILKILLSEKACFLEKIVMMNRESTPQTH